MQLLVMSSLALLYLAAGSNEDSWSEISETSPALLGGSVPTDVPESMRSRRKQYLVAKLNEVRAKCTPPLAPVKDLVVNNITEQVVEGTEYTADVTVDGVDKVVSFVKLLENERRPHHFSTEQGQGSIEDLFSLTSIVPHPCGADTAVLTDTDYETDAEIDAKYKTGLVMPEHIEYAEMSVTQEMKASLPVNFDWRDEIWKRYAEKPKAATVLNQGSCGSCWAFGGAAAAGYRTIIASKGQYNVVPSTQAGMTCSHQPPKNPCKGGWFNNLYDTLNKYEIPANWAVPYIQKRGQCPVVSDSISIKGGTSRSIRGVDAMMVELHTNGPFGMAIDAGPSCFKRYKSGVADCQGSGVSHAVVALGWGTENGKKYWLVQNSWGAGWGAAGFIKVARGSNALNMEHHGAQPNYISPDKMDCNKSPPCKNGGAFKKDCSCHCLGGYSGAQCDSCQKSCSGNQFTGQAAITAGKCACKCKSGFVSPSNLLGYSDCALKMQVGGSASAMVKVARGSTVNVAFDVVGTPPSDAIQNVKKGDMYVAVRAGNTPWTAAGGWTTDIKADVCAAKSWPASKCGASTAQLTFTQDGVFDLFYVKYLGRSEFGTDKGYGSDFMLIPQRICVGNVNCDDAPGSFRPANTVPPPPPSCQCKGNTWFDKSSCTKHKAVQSCLSQKNWFGIKQCKCG